jgi:gluconate 2-dehydrogenase gamma chain
MDTNGSGVAAEALMFFNEREAQTVDALAARVIPTDAGDPGAREARAVIFIDRALAGAYGELRPLYRHGLRRLDEYCRARTGGSFTQLTEAEQDGVLESLDIDEAERPDRAFADSTGAQEAAESDPESLPYFFAVVREHVLQGFFCDPMYGGNQGAVGWRLVGFPGAHWSYADYQGRSNFDSREIPIQTLGDLRRQRQAIDIEREAR